jgi:ADP-heptose:LPS heptosyltransferase
MSIKKILLLEFSRIGDTVMHEPTLRALKLHYPGAEIHAYTDAANFDILVTHPALSRVEVFKRKIKSLPDVWCVIKLLKNIRKEKYDLLVNFYMGGISINLTRFSGIKKRLAFDRNPHLARVCNLVMRSPSSFSNWIVEFRELLRPLGIDPASIWPQPKLFLSDEFKDTPREFLALDKIYVAYNLATSDPDKCWSVKHYVTLAERLYHEYHFIPVLVSNPGQADLVAEFQALYPKDLPLIVLPVLRLLKLASLLKATHMVITGDTGIMHMAFALDVPTIAIFTNGRPEFAVAPMTRKMIVFEADPDAPKYPSGQLHGRRELPVALVEAGVKELLKVI